MASFTISPVPNKSKISDKDGIVQLDWLRWFSSVLNYCTRLLNSYDNNKSGLVTLVAGTLVVANTNIQSTSVLRLIPQNSGNEGFLSVTLNPGVGFTIISTNILDTRNIFYEILEAF